MITRHVTVLLQEAVTALQIRAEGTYVDCTFGRGGHSRAILERLGARGRLIALDRDAEAEAAAAQLDDPRFTFVRAQFSALKNVVAQFALPPLDGVLLDLGISSPQIDQAERGFSFRLDGPLDMRMDASRGLSAAQWLADVEESDLREVLKRYGEERFAKQIARAIVAARAQKPIETTRELAEIVSAAMPRKEPGQDPATRTFQAIRIFLNAELDELTLTLPQTLEVLAPGGRLVVISFHSLEDRIVKRFMRTAAQSDDLPARLPVRHADVYAPKMRTIGKALRPSAEEVLANPRARSAVMRVAERMPFA